MKSKFVAGISLAIMAAGFIATLFIPTSTGQLIAQGGFEAGLVGGIADWFAVTALFRHPLGIPIPHTSLLLKNKDRIVQSLISSMENELLNKDSIKNKLKQWHLLRAATKGLAKLLRKRSNRIAVLDAATELVRGLPIDKVVPSIRNALSEYARGLNVKPIAQSAVSYAMDRRMDEKALDYALTKASDWVERPDTAYMLGKLASEKLSSVNVRGFMGFAVQAISGFMSEEKLGAILQGMIASAIHDLRDPNNAHRDSIVKEIRDQLVMLANDDEKLTRLNTVIEQAIASNEGEQWIASMVDKARTLLLTKLEAEKASGGQAVFRAYRGAVRLAGGNEEAVARWEDRLLNGVLHAVESNHYRIGGLVKENLDRMDDKTLIAMLEDKVGNDLQWIRVNGALCGFAIGIVLSLFQL
ncbi:DUF445 domain-containing protein [Cohnella yongneupensis]|uniref:DUF445 domain-containing protein n=1 Tax=Cohnella yongneupensis TaxID=425006 RepID=A0ABW0QZ00_9BACL